MNQMTEKLSITKEQLVTLLKAAQQAYQGQAKPPASTSDDWVEWYANFIIDKLKQPVQPAESTRSTQVSQRVQAAPPGEASAAKPTVPGAPVLPTTSKLPDHAVDADNAGNGEAKQEPPPRKDEAETGALQVCPTCAHRNRPGVLFCENCGTNLITGQQAALGTRDLREGKEAEASQTGKLDQQSTSTGIQLDKDQERAVRSAGTSVFSAGMLLRIEVEGGSTPIIIKPKAEDMILGRRDPTTGATPEVDLTAYAGYRMGVSRRHASLALENEQLSLWDLGSSNGTFINGTRLTPHQPNPVRDGDEVRLGQMVLRLFFQNAPTTKS